MSDFPTLSIMPDQVPWRYISNDIKSEPEAGKVIARPRFTSAPRIYEPEYAKMSESDFDLLMAFYLTVETYNIFNWTYKGVTLSVRFKDPIRNTDIPPRWHHVIMTIVTV